MKWYKRAQGRLSKKENDGIMLKVRSTASIFDICLIKRRKPKACISLKRPVAKLQASEDHSLLFPSTQRTGYRRYICSPTTERMWPLQVASSNEGCLAFLVVQEQQDLCTPSGPFKQAPEKLRHAMYATKQGKKAILFSSVCVCCPSLSRWSIKVCAADDPRLDPAFWGALVGRSGSRAFTFKGSFSWDSLCLSRWLFFTPYSVL